MQHLFPTSIYLRLVELHTMTNRKLAPANVESPVEPSYLDPGEHEPVCARNHKHMHEVIYTVMYIV